MEGEAGSGSDPALAVLGQVHQLTQLVLQLQQQHIQMQAASIPSVKCPIAPPEKFSGKPEDFAAFLAQCQLFIELRDREFLSDKAKVCFIISLLTGQAAKWATPLLLSPSPLLNNYQGFLQHISAAFANPLQAATANRRIRALKQGKNSVFQYATEFKILAQDLQWNDPALKDQFMEGLQGEVLDELARVNQPDTLQGLITLCLQIDGRLENRKMAKATPSSSLPPPRPTPTPVRPANMELPEPMQLGAVRPRLSPEEKARRRSQNLCLYCGGRGHFAASCSLKHGPSTVAGSAAKGQPLV